MTKKELKNYKENLIKENIENYIQGRIDKLDAKNKKLLKEFLKKDLDVCLYSLTYIKEEYFSWEVGPKDYNLNSNFDRLIYLLNNSYEFCEELLNRDSVDTTDSELNIKISNLDLEDYNELAKKVGL